MIRHHPDDELLMALATGTLTPGPGVVTAAHTERCSRCDARLMEFEALGGSLLEDLEPTALASDALVHTLARIDAAASPLGVQSPAPGGMPSRTRPRLPAGVAWPRSLRGSQTTGWRRLGPGVRWSRVRVDDNDTSHVYLLRVAAGKRLPLHSHCGGEFTLVLHGAFYDGSERFAAGDFEEADQSVHHQPVVAASGECVCLTSVDGRIAFEGRIARMLGSVFRM